MVSVDEEILSSTWIGCSRPDIKEIIEGWLKYEVITGARHCTECFLTRVVVNELRKKGVPVRVDDLSVEGGYCDFKINPDYKVEIKKSLTGETDLVKEIKKKTESHSDCNPFLLIYISVLPQWVKNVTDLEGRIKSTCGSEWELSPPVKLPFHEGFAVLAKKMNQPPYSTGSK